MNGHELVRGIWRFHPYLRYLYITNKEERLWEWTGERWDDYEAGGTEPKELKVSRKYDIILQN